jgi:hypothetical protein
MDDLLNNSEYSLQQRKYNLDDNATGSIKWIFYRVISWSKIRNYKS